MGCLYACMQLDHLLQELFPCQQAQRLEDLQASTWLPTIWSTSPDAHLPPGQLYGTREQLEATLARSAAHKVSQGPVQATQTSTPAAGGLGTSIGLGGGELATNLTAAFSDRFVHYRIGCDSCGVFPIVGKRYRCRDCSERIGFDLCGACYDNQRNICGRFNQQHRPGGDAACADCTPAPAQSFPPYASRMSTDHTVYCIIPIDM